MSSLLAGSALVIGGGVMGCAVAAALGREGWQVTVLERAVPGAEASSAAAGMLGAQTESEAEGPLLQLALASRALWPAFAAELQARTGIPIGYVQHGTLELARDAAAVGHLEARAVWMKQAGLRATLLDADGARQLEPALGPAVVAALHLPDDHQVEPPLLVRALAADAALAGAQFVSGEAVQNVQWHAAGVQVQTSHALRSADVLVVAAGAWTDTIPGLQALPRRRATIRPVHGQLVQLDAQRAVFRHNLVQAGGYLVPRPDGRVIAGATTEDTGFAKRVTAGGLHALLGMAMTAVPVLRDAPVVQHWSGLRPHSSDALPLLGRATAAPQVVFASGHYRNGILLTPITARLVVDQLLGRPSLLPIAPYAA